MTVKMKQGFFKVAASKPFVPLTTRYYGYEADNLFEIRKLGGTTVASYYGMSHGMGKVLSIFNEEYFLFHNGASQVMCIAPDDTVTTLLTITGVDEASIITMDNNFMVVSKTGNDITVKSYIIAGAPQDFWAELVDTQTISGPAGFTAMTKPFGCRASETDVYACLAVVSGPAYKTLKIVSNNGFGPSATLSWESGNVQDMPIPAVGNMLYSCAGNRYYWSNEYNYYVTKSGTTYTLFHRDGTQIWLGTLTGAGVNFHIDQETGDGYVLEVYTQDVQNQRTVGKLYSLQSGVLTLVTTVSGGNIPSISGWVGINNVMPLVDGLVAPVCHYERGTGDKVTGTTSSLTVTGSINASLTTFASGVRFA